MLLFDVSSELALSLLARQIFLISISSFLYLHRSNQGRMLRTAFGFPHLKAMCEYIKRGETSDFKLLSDEKCILGRTVRVKEVESLPKAIYFASDHKKIVRLQN